jgi:excinuclease ABC subunit C
MKEVVFRRYSSLIMKNEILPDLILIDGGKGQLNAALSALEKLQLKITVISLAKKNE